MRARRLIGASLVLAALAAPASAAAEVRRATAPALPRAEAAGAVKRAAKLLRGNLRARGAEQRAHELTPQLLRVARGAPNLAGAQRRAARALLARPTDGFDPGGNTYSIPEHAPLCTAHFCVHFVTQTIDAPPLADANGASDGDGFPDYVETVAAAAERSYDVENTQLGWLAPKSDGGLGGDGRSDIYLAQIGNEGLFGYAAPDLGQGRQRSRYAYLVLDDDYLPGEYGGTPALTSLQATFAHEYNHVLQFTYDVAQDLWMYESTATWMEDYVFGELDDYFRYMPRWAAKSKVPLTRESIKIYGSAVWNHWLAWQLGGPQVVRSVWERGRTTRPLGFSVNAYDSAIRAAAGTGFATQFARFAVATAEWGTPGVFPYVDAPAYPDMRRRGRLRGVERRRLDNTSYALLDVRPRNVAAIRFVGIAPRRVRAGFGLVCRVGGGPAAAVETQTAFAKRGGARSIKLRDPGRCARITAVLVNADGRQGGRGPAAWRYRRDNEVFAARLRVNP